MERMTVEELAGLKQQAMMCDSLGNAIRSVGLKKDVLLRLVEQAGRVEGLEKARNAILQEAIDAICAADKGLWQDESKGLDIAITAVEALMSAPASQLDAPAPPEVAVNFTEDPMDIVRTLVCMADRIAELPEDKRDLYPSPLADFSPLMQAARQACIERGYTDGGLAVEGAIYPAAPAGFDERESFIWSLGYRAGKEPASPAVPVAAGLPAIPEGWKLVPLKPTDKMREAAAKADDEGFGLGRSHGASSVEIYDAMLAAAPVLPVEVPSQPQSSLLTEVADVLAEQNWRGDLVDALRDAAQSSPIAEPDTATQAAKPLTDERLEEIAASWDGCTYEAPGEVVDIGQDLRRAFKRDSQSHLKGE